MEDTKKKELAEAKQRVAELEEEERKDSRQSFLKLVTDEFTKLAVHVHTEVQEIVICQDPKELYNNLHSALDFARNPGDCDAVRVTFANKVTIAFAGTPRGSYAQFEVRTPEFKSNPLVLCHNRNAEAAYQDWTSFEEIIGVPDIDKQMKAIADKLRHHPYIARCSIGYTSHIKKPKKVEVISYEWD
jgi:hypothetical protein